MRLRSPADQLTAFLHADAGLGFYYQLFCAASDRSSPLLEYEYVKRVSESWDVLAVLVRSKVNGQIHLLKLVRKGVTRSVSYEMTLQLLQ